MRGIYVLALGILLVSLTSIFVAHGAQTQTINKVGTTSLYIFGVSTEANGTTVGVPALLTLTITNGTGQVYLGSNPLAGTDTQAQAEVSARVACQLINVNCDEYNFYYYITSSSAEIGGPSAGAAFAIAAMSILSGHPLNKNVAMTGTANPDGSIGLVGDVAPKSEAAANQGIKVFLYPAYEPAADNITSQAITYAANLGMVTVPITSVYQAYQYFTGYNITPAIDYNIYTGLYNSEMNLTYYRFNNYQQAIYDSLPSKNSTNSTVKYLISQSLSAMQHEQALVANGNYYVAASYIVNTSAPFLLYAKTLEQISASSDPQQFMYGLINSENASIQQTYDQITSDYVTNSSTLELKLIAIDRLTGVGGATYFLNQAPPFVNYSIQNAAYFYSMAEVKRASSVFWLSIVPTGNSNFSEASYYNLSNYYLYKASSYIYYAGLLSSLDTTQLQSDLNVSQTYQDGGHYMASIFNSIQTIALAELAIEENSISVNGSTSQVTTQIATSAIRKINAAERAGITPFLGISYYQYGESFGPAALANYIEFESLSRGYTDFESNLANASLIPFNAISQPAALPSLPWLFYQDVAYALLGIIIGMLVAGAIYEYKLYRIVKRNAVGHHARAARTQGRHRGAVRRRSHKKRNSRRR